MKNTKTCFVYSAGLGLLVHAVGMTAYADGATSIQSAFINYRHQYLEDTRLHSDRFLLGVRLSNGLGFQGQVKYKTGGQREDVAYDNMVGDGHEFLMDYQYKLDKKWTLIPSVDFVGTESAVTYRPALRVNYKPNDKLALGVRYRYEVRKLDRDKIDKSAADRGRQDQHTDRYDIFLDYATGGSWSFGYNLTYFDSDFIRYDNKKHDYEQNLTVRYRINKRWVPSIELGDVKVNATDNDRQLRFRAGITYNFIGKGAGEALVNDGVYIESGSINYRHQYLDDTKAHSDRFLLGVRLSNGLGFEGQVKYKTGGQRKDVAYDNMVGDGYEFLMNYQYKLNKKWTFIPSFDIVGTESAMTYRPALRANYKINDSFTLGARYRYEVRKLDRDKIDKSAAARARQDQHTDRYDLFLDYSPGGAWSFGYNFSYFDSDFIRYDNEKNDYEQNLTIRYAINKRWMPSIELGDVKVSSLESDRQLRLRAGITYKF